MMMKKTTIFMVIIFLLANATWAFSLTKKPIQNSTSNIKALQSQINQLKSQAQAKDKTINSLKKTNDAIIKNNKKIINEIEAIAKNIFLADYIPLGLIPHGATVAVRVLGIKKIYYNGVEVALDIVKKGELFISPPEIRPIDYNDLKNYYVSMDNLKDIFNKTMAWDDINKIMYFDDYK